ncbi:MAG: peptidase domain-containing ABC transporter [Candidatus Delongbacteria bacterium]|nr:peptidase domain-containing ABC transporter [Candidatus Delongbacteria bacterium]
MDCGATCLRIIAKYYKKKHSLEYLREKAFTSREGVSLLSISNAAEQLGFRTRGVKISYDSLKLSSQLPCIVHWNQNHFVVVYKINDKFVHVSDPAHGLLKYSREDFEKRWASDKLDDSPVGIALLLEPSPDFYNIEDEKHKVDKTSFKFLLHYVKPYKKLIYQLIIGMAAGSLIQLIFPFLAQAIVDVGISKKDVNFIIIILIAQLSLFLGRASIEFIRSWILLHLSTRINISIISDFLIKLMKLPIKFFDVKMTGDLLQRINDHHRIESFLTNSTLSTLFSGVNFIIFSIVLIIYNLNIFLVFLLGSIFYVVWIRIFMKKRKELDVKKFEVMSENNGNLIQMITGMQEIKLNTCEKQKRWEWENIQAKLFKLNVKSLSLDQYQNSGGMIINEGKNIIISFLSAYSVIKGDMTLGMMISVQYIIGQLNSPISQLIFFMHSMQDAKISLERLGEIHNKEDEENTNLNKITDIGINRTISVNNLSFQYEGPESEFVLKNISLTVPQGKITAVVGTSGSGKTTLLKLILGFYKPQKGNIEVGKNDLEIINSNEWRKKCGVVMQEGFIFSDTIANNISISDEKPDKEKLKHAVHVANIEDFIETLPLGYNTKIGNDGHGLSQGQKQRILIARSVYKNPEFIFFDEATNALDANNEKVIMENLDQFFKGKTVIIVAHRLSTVKNADQIVVIEKGKIIEKGTHKELAELKGAYFNLVKNQLELGN